MTTRIAKRRRTQRPRGDPAAIQREWRKTGDEEERGRRGREAKLLKVTMTIDDTDETSSELQNAATIRMTVMFDGA